MPKGGSTRAKADVKRIDKEVAELGSSNWNKGRSAEDIAKYGKSGLEPVLEPLGKVIHKTMQGGENLKRKIQGKETRAELLARRKKAKSASDQSDDLKRKAKSKKDFIASSDNAVKRYINKAKKTEKENASFGGKRFMNGGCVMAGRGVRKTKMG